MRTFAEDEVERKVDELVRRGGERDDRADCAEAALDVYIPSVIGDMYARAGRARAPGQEPGVDAVRHEHAYRGVRAALAQTSGE